MRKRSLIKLLSVILVTVFSITTFNPCGYGQTLSVSRQDTLAIYSIFQKSGITDVKSLSVALTVAEHLLIEEGEIETLAKVIRDRFRNNPDALEGVSLEDVSIEGNVVQVPCQGSEGDILIAVCLNELVQSGAAPEAEWVSAGRFAVSTSSIEDDLTPAEKFLKNANGSLLKLPVSQFVETEVLEMLYRTAAPILIEGRAMDLYHTTTVIKNMEEIARREQLSPEKGKVLVTTALLHDIGYQTADIADYRTADKRLAHMERGSKMVIDILPAINKRLGREYYSQEDIAEVSRIISIHDLPSTKKPLPSDDRMALTFRQADRLAMLQMIELAKNIGDRSKPESRVTPVEQLAHVIKRHTEERDLYEDVPRGTLFIEETLYTTEAGYNIFTRLILERAQDIRRGFYGPVSDEELEKLAEIEKTYQFKRNIHTMKNNNIIPVDRIDFRDSPPKPSEFFDGVAGPEEKPFERIVEATVITEEDAARYARDYEGVATSAHEGRVGAPDGDGTVLLNLVDPQIGELINDTESLLYKIVEKADPRFVSFHIGYSSRTLQRVPYADPRTIKGRTTAAEHAPPLSREELMEEMSRNINTLRTNLEKKGFEGEFLIESLDYAPGGAYEHMCEPSFIKELLERTGAKFLLDVAHIFISSRNLPAYSEKDHMDYVKELINEETVGLVGEMHLSVPYFMQDDNLWADFHMPFSFRGEESGREYLDEIIKYVVVLRKKAGLVEPLPVAFETGRENFDKDIEELEKLLTEASQDQHRIEEVTAPKDWRGTGNPGIAPLTGDESDAFTTAYMDMIAVNGINMELLVPVESGKTLWHVIPIDLVPFDIRPDFIHAIEAINRDFPDLREKIEVVTDRQDLAAVVERLAADPANIVDVAVPGADHLEGLPGNVKALVFEGELGDFRQLEGILAALRALQQSNVDTLLRLYQVLTGQSFEGDEEDIRKNIANPKQLASIIIFNLKPIEVQDFDELKRLNENLLKILRAA